MLACRNEWGRNEWDRDEWDRKEGDRDGGRRTGNGTGILSWDSASSLLFSLTWCFIVLVAPTKACRKEAT